MFSRQKRDVAGVALLVSVAALTLFSYGGFGPLVPYGSASNADTWSFLGQNQQNTWYSPQDVIGPSNVANLKLVWFASLPRTAGTPVVSGGIVYVSGEPIIEALDENTGSVIWSAGPPNYNFSTNAGVTIDSGNLFAGTVDGYLVSLNALTGIMNWKVSVRQSLLGSNMQYEGPQAAALVYNNEVIIGETGGDNGARGFVRAFSESDGSLLWTFYTVPPDPITNTNQDPYGNTWAACSTCSGGDVWGVPALDPQTGTIYFGTGNPYPDYDSSLRSQTADQTNLYTESIIALNAQNGQMLWYRQIVPTDTHDWDHGVPVQLFTTTINGITKKVVGSGGKNGYYDILDASNGNLISSSKVGVHQNEQAAPTLTGVTVYPGGFGGINTYSSYDPQTNMIYTMAYNRASNYSITQNGISFKEIVAGENSTLYGLDASSGSVSWSRTLSGLGGGASSTNGLVFTTDGTGSVYALDASTGSVRWKYSVFSYTGTFIWNWGPPAVVDGTVFLTRHSATSNGGVYAFKPQGSTSASTTTSKTTSTSKTTTTSTSGGSATTTMVVSYSVVGGGTPTPPVFHYVLSGVSKSATLTKTATSVTVDSGSAWSVTPNPLTGSTSSERWRSSQSLIGTASATTLVFTYQHQYYLTMKVSSSTAGSVTPSSGWHNAGQTITIKATAKTGHTFKSWTGAGTGSYTGISPSHTITMNSAITETANFV